MHLAYAIPERGGLIAARLDDELPLGVTFDPTFPSIYRVHDRQQVHAGGKVFLDQRTGECHGVRIRRKRGQDKYVVSGRHDGETWLLIGIWWAAGANPGAPIGRKYCTKEPASACHSPRIP